MTIKPEMVTEAYGIVRNPFQTALYLIGSCSLPFKWLW